MYHEWTRSATVHAGGKIEVILPELTAGSKVEVTVRTVDTEPVALSAEEKAKRLRLALSHLKERGVEGANIPDEALRREEMYSDRT